MGIHLSKQTAKHTANNFRQNIEIGNPTDQID